MISSKNKNKVGNGKSKVVYSDCVLGEDVSDNIIVSIDLKTKMLCTMSQEVSRQKEQTM